MLISDDSSVQENHVRHDKKKDKLALFKHTFTTMTVVGCWQPLSWLSPIKYKLYSIYTLFLTLMLLIFAISQFMIIVLNAANPEDFTSVLYMMTAMCMGIFKISNMWLNRKNYADIINTLIDEPFRPVIADEIKIRQNFDRMIWNNTLFCLVLVGSTCGIIVLTSLFTNFRTGELTYKAWLPFNYSSPALFFFVYTHQLISIITGALVNLACDCFICGLLLHICCQIEILDYRLNKSHTWENLRNCFCFRSE
ncbi:putative odorant receptor 71a isoform X2 [Monomorium pharaonis]|uniref:putative odorant receptor 71a isoform X2 n=1 Tax=Monomorium pharaonis TaxID=307658 RepID=UPI00102E1A29|nr:putative odorant receptor 71a isoform X2 [Monomorium pharaonis]